MKFKGNFSRTSCPVCASEKMHEVWAIIPFSRIDPVVVNGCRVSAAPMLNANEHVRFMQCTECQSVYESPVADEQGHRGTHYIDKMYPGSPSWEGYEKRYSYFRSWIPAGATIMIDAACGVGQYLTVAKSARDFNWSRLVGLEYNPEYVKAMPPWIDARTMSLNDDPVSVAACDNADFIVFSEAFEHMRYAYVAMKKLCAMLRPGGRIFFTSQALECAVPVRPEETIYTSAIGIVKVADLCGMKLLSNAVQANGRYYTVMEKPEGGNGIPAGQGESG